MGISQARSSTVPELQGKLHDLGFQVGARILDLMFVREPRADELAKEDVRAVAWGAAKCGPARVTGGPPPSLPAILAEQEADERRRPATV